MLNGEEKKRDGGTTWALYSFLKWRLEGKKESKNMGEMIELTELNTNKKAYMTNKQTNKQPRKTKHE